MHHGSACTDCSFRAQHKHITCVACLTRNMGVPAHGHLVWETCTYLRHRRSVEHSLALDPFSRAAGQVVIGKTRCQGGRASDSSLRAQPIQSTYSPRDEFHLTNVLRMHRQARMRHTCPRLPLDCATNAALTLSLTLSVSASDCLWQSLSALHGAISHTPRCISAAAHVYGMSHPAQPASSSRTLSIAHRPPPSHPPSLSARSAQARRGKYRSGAMPAWVSLYPGPPLGISPFAEIGDRDCGRSVRTPSGDYGPGPGRGPDPGPPCLGTYGTGRPSFASTMNA